MLSEIKILGFDLGHGETAVTILNGADNSNKPEPIFDPESQPTLFGYLDKELKWGKKARNFIANNEIDDDPELLEICFKSKPRKEDTEQHNIISQFATTVINDAFDKKPQLKEEKVETFIGCPSGWTDDDIKNYLKIFKNTKVMRNPTIVKESRAAFTYHYDSKDYANNFSNEDLQKPIILLDFGSSTLDATLVIGREDEALSGDDQGWPLGAAFIEQALLNWSLKNCTKLASETIKEIRDYINQSSLTRTVAELDMRKIKEEFFNYYDSYPEGKPLKKNIEIDYDLRLPIVIDQKSMEDLLNQPLVKIVPSWSLLNKDEEIETELSNYSWLEYCRKCLENICEKLEEKDYSPEDVGRVIITGGGSLMKPVQEVIKEFFPDKLMRDDKPSLAISLGLASWGRIDIKTRGLEEDVKAFCGEHEENLRNIINKHYKSSCLNIKSWMRSNDEEKQVIIGNLDEMIRNDIKEPLGNICEKYGIDGFDFMPKPFLENYYEKLSKSAVNDRNEFVSTILDALLDAIKTKKDSVKFLIASQ